MKAKVAKIKSRKRLVLIIVASVVVVTIAVAIAVAIFAMKGATSGEVKFTGKITKEDCTFIIPPSCVWNVDGTSVNWSGGIIPGDHNGGPRGLTGTDDSNPHAFDDNWAPDVGKKVEVYGKRDGENSVTLSGSDDYYIKAL